jgi:ABC-type dipeptide/oligopeptide/nickel transport system permease component
VGSRYVARHLLLFVPTLVGASILIFVLVRLVPGDIAEILVYQHPACGEDHRPSSALTTTARSSAPCPAAAAAA